MALYYFHLCDGRDTLIDPDGRELEELDLIPAAALKEARAMISQDASADTSGSNIISKCAMRPAS